LGVMLVSRVRKSVIKGSNKDIAWGAQESSETRSQVSGVWAWTSDLFK
jgi:hypothetical protein